MINKVFILIIFIFSYSKLKSQVFSIDTSHQANELIEKYFISKNHNGIRIRDIRYSGMKNARGLFVYSSKFGDLPRNGIILSTGNAIDAMGPNNEIASTKNHYKGDKDLSDINNAKTFDASILEFDFMSLSDSINFVFQFASEEYPNYVKKGVSDIFGFFVTDLATGVKRNIALLPNTNIPLTIDLINNNKNSEYYICNNNRYKYDGGLKRDKQFYENQYLFNFNGYTRPIYSGIKLNPYKWYHFKIAIADIGDMKFDSWIFLKGNSFVSNGSIINPDIKDLKEYYHLFNDDSLIVKTTDNKIHILLPIYFNFNSSKITSTSFKILDFIKNIIQYSNYNLIINGFADETGSDEYNIRLSQERANSVLLELTNNGISTSRMQAFGKGEIKSNKELDKSRKVEFILY